MQNRRMAAAMGIRTPVIDAMTFGLGSGVAGIAGVALSQIDNVSPNLGQGYIIDSFMVVVLGGVGNFWGTFASAMALGVANKLIEPIAGGGARAQLADANRFTDPHPDLCRAADWQINLLCHPRFVARSRLGLLRHSQPSARRVLCARRVCHGHVSDAPDRRAWRLREPRPARFHGVPQLEAAALVLVWLQITLVCAAHGVDRAWRASTHYQE